MEYLKAAIAKRRQKNKDDLMGKEEIAAEEAMSGTKQGEDGMKEMEIAPERKPAGNLKEAFSQMMEKFSSGENGGDDDGEEEVEDVMESGNMVSDDHGDADADAEQLARLMGLYNEDAVGKPGLSGRIAGKLKEDIDRIKAKQKMKG